MKSKALSPLASGIGGMGMRKMRTHKKLNLLILGYKDYGRGIAYYAAHKEVERKLRWVREHVIDLSDRFRSICFDDVSARQLGMKG